MSLVYTCMTLHAYESSESSSRNAFGSGIGLPQRRTAVRLGQGTRAGMSVRPEGATAGRAGPGPDAKTPLTAKCELQLRVGLRVLRPSEQERERRHLGAAL